MPIPAYVDGDLRVQFLSESLVRIERKGPEGFEDRPTFTALGRSWPGTPYVRHGDRLVAKGYTVVLHGGDFQGVSLVVGGKTVYTVGDLPKPQWLPDPGKTGPVWSLADAPRMVPPKGGAIPKNAAKGPNSGFDVGNDAPDLYLFVTRDPKVLRRDFLRLTGPIPLVPRFALGFWDSRWYPYTEGMALASIDAYHEHGLPLDLFVCDTDWRVGASKGYGVNTKLFPDMAGFLERAHAKGVRVMFNDHPEPQAPTALEPKETTYRWTGLTDLLDRGLDVWWFDRNWSTRLHEPMPGLDPETWGSSAFHDVTQAFRPSRRPLIMSNVDGIDNGIRNRPPHPAFHRYPVNWTGDTGSSWAYLQRGVENGVDEGAVGMLPYVNEDLGGHTGDPSPELYTRFLQYGALSPVMRVHCTYLKVRYPWAFGPLAEQASEEAIRFRYRLIPTLYSATFKAHEDGTPLLRRLDLEWPQFPEAASSRQYLLGDDLLVSPVTKPDVPEMRSYPGTFRAEYFPNKDLSGAPVLVRDAERIDFDWGQGSPAPELPVDGFSARWAGRFNVPTTMDYRFGTSTDDGVRLWIDGKPVVDQWKPLDSETFSGIVRLEAGEHDLRMEYFEDGGGANAHLLWSGAEPPRQGPMKWSIQTPPGDWVDLWTGWRYGSSDHFASWSFPAPLRQFPLMLRQGAILFLGDDRVRNADEQLKRPITVEAWPDRRTERTMTEDDGLSVRPKKRFLRATALTTRTGARIALNPSGGSRDLVVRLHLRPDQKPTAARWRGRPIAFRSEAPSAPAQGLDEIFRARMGYVAEVRLPACAGGVLEVVAPPSSRHQARNRTYRAPKGVSSHPCRRTFSIE